MAPFDPQRTLAPDGHTLCQRIEFLPLRAFEHDETYGGIRCDSERRMAERDARGRLDSAEIEESKGGRYALLYMPLRNTLPSTTDI